MSVHWRRDRFPIAVFADAEMLLTAFRTDRTGHLLRAAPYMYDAEFVVFTRFKALIMEPAAFTYAHRHDNIEAIDSRLRRWWE
jgi:hypothetical protein